MASLSTQNQEPTPGLPSNNNAIVIAEQTNNGTDQLGNLLPLTWTSGGQTISFPAMMFKEESSHDLAIHKYPNVDAGRIENTGRNPSAYHIRAILTNNIFPGPDETWLHGKLFPQVFNNLEVAFLADSQNASPGVLQHPFLGNITCRVHSWTYEFVSKFPRDGVFMDINLIETIGEQSLLETVSIGGDPISQLSSSAASLDSEVSNGSLSNSIPGGLSDFPIPLSPPGLNFTGFFSAISNQVANFAGYQNQPLPAINFSIYSSSNTSLTGVNNQGQAQYNVNKGTVLNATVNVGTVYTLQTLKDVYASSYSVNNSASNNPSQLINNSIYFYTCLIKYYKSFNQVGTANMELGLFKSIQSCQQILNTLASNNQGYTVNTYQVNIPTSIVALTRLLNNTVDQLISLNPNMENYLIPQNTLINYYQG